MGIQLIIDNPGRGYWTYGGEQVSAADPGANTWKTNAGNTRIDLSVSALNGLSAQAILAQFENGAFVQVRLNGEDRLYSVQASTDNTTWFELTVSLESQSTSWAITTGDTCSVVLTLPKGAGGGGGVTDHGALTGLSDDDHAQYFNQTRGDIRYYTQAEVDAGLAGSIDQHADVDITTTAPNDDEVLIWQTNKFVPGPAAVPDATTTTKGIVELAADGEAAANVVVQGDDARLADERVDSAARATANAALPSADFETTHDALPADNPHGVTAAQVGLGSADDTADADKPVSTAQAAADTAVANAAQTALDNHTHEGTEILSTAEGAGKVLTSTAGGVSSWEGAGAPGAHDLGGASHTSGAEAEFRIAEADGVGGVRWGDKAAAGVSSVFGRQNDVLAEIGDYDASEVSNDSGVAGADVAAALDQLDSDIAAGSTLESAVNAPTPDNDITIPTGDPVIFRDGAVAALTPVTIAKTNSTNSNPALLVEYNTLNGGIDVESTNSLTKYTSSGVRFSGAKITGGYAVEPEIATGAQAGKFVRVAGGNAAIGSDADGGDLVLTAGAEDGSGTAGKIQVGLSSNQTSVVELGATGVPANVLEDLDVAGDITVSGTVDTVDIATFKSEFDDHSDRHLQTGGDELTAQLLGSGAETVGKLMFTDGAGGWTVADETSIDHDQLTNFLAAEHIDWSASGAEQIDASRYSSGTGGATNTVAGTSPIENTGDNTNAVLALESQAEETFLGRATGAGAGVPGVLTQAQAQTALNVEDGSTADQTAGEIEAIVSHDNLLDFAANEHIDWTTDQGATNIDTGNVPVATTTTIGLVELATDGESAADKVVQGNDARLADARTPTAHNQDYTTIGAVPTDTFLGRDLAGTGFAEALTPAVAAGLLDHADLGAGAGTNTHAQIDTHIAASFPHTGTHSQLESATPDAGAIFASLQTGQLEGLTDVAAAAGQKIPIELNGATGAWRRVDMDDLLLSANNLSDVTASTARTNLGIAPITGAGTPGVSTGNGRILGTIYVDTTADLGYTLADATTDANVWSAGGGGGTTILTGAVDPTTEGSNGDFYYNTVKRGYWYKDSGTWEEVGVVADDVTLEVDATNGLQIKDDGVTLAKIDAHTGAVAGVLGYGVSGTPSEISSSATTGHVLKGAGTGAPPVFGQCVTDSYGTGTVTVAKIANGTDGELITWSAAGVATTVPAGTDTHVLTSNGPDTVPTFQAAPSAPTLSRSITIEDPGTAEDITMFFTPVAITITDIRSLTIGGTSTVNFDLYESAFATRATTTAINGSNMTADTNGNTDTTFNNAGVAANSWVSLKTTTGGTAGATEMHVTVVYTED